MAKGLPPFSERLPDVTIYEVIPTYDDSGNFVEAQVNCDDLEGASVWFNAKIAPDLKVRPTFATSGPRFTNQFDPPEYEAFYLSVSSALGWDESAPVEECSRAVVELIEEAKRPDPLWRVTYRHRKAGITDEAFVRASASGNALIKFAGTCVQPDEIDVVSCDEVEVSE